MSLQRRKPLKRGKPMARGEGLHSRTVLTRSTPLHRGKPLPLVSRKRARQNRERAAVIAEVYPVRPACQCGRQCGLLADDVHEILSRARGGSITDEGNFRALARACHDEVTFTPESELGWAYSAGLLKHSWSGVAA